MGTLARAQLRDRGLLAILVVVLLLSALGTAIAADLVDAATTGVRAGVAGLRGAAGGYRITMPLAADVRAQDARVRRAIDAVHAPDGEPVPSDVQRDLESPDAVPFEGPRGNVRAAAASIADLRAHAALVDGRWPADAAHASVQADAARFLHVRVGDRLRLPRGGAVTISGTWRVRDPGDPRWLSSELPLAGIDDADVAGFIVIDPSLWDRTGVRPLARWTVLPRSGLLTADQLPALDAAPTTVPARLLAARADGDDIDQDGGLQRALLPLEQRLQAAEAVAAAPVVLLALVGLLTLGELVRAREHGRRGDRELLRARGASRGRMAAWAAPEAVVVALAAAAGAGVAGLVAPGAAGSWWIVATAVGTVAIAMLLIGAAGPRDALGRGRGRRRRRPIVEASVIGLAVVAAIVALGQLLVYGSPLLPTADGGTALDPLAVAAPALVIVALALLAVAAFPLLRRPVERRIPRTAGAGAIATRHLVRRARNALAPMLLIGLALATGALAVSYSGSWQATADRTRTAQVGTDVRVASATALPVPRSPRADEAPAATAEVQLADGVVPMVEVPAASAARMIAPVPGVVDPAALARRIGPGTSGPRIPAGSDRAVLTLAASSAAALPDAFDLVVRDAGGVAQTLYASRHGRTYTVVLPAGRGPFVVRALDLQLAAVDPGSTVRVASLHVTGGGEVDLAGDWAPTDARTGARALGRGQAGIRVAVPATGIRVRLMPRSARNAIRIVVSAPLAHAGGLSAGSRVDLPIVASGGSVPAVVTAVVPVVPGVPGDDGVLADLGAVQDAVLAADLGPTQETERWIRTTDPAAAAVRAERGLPPTATVTTRLPAPEDAVLESARRTALLSAGATILLAGAATTAIAADETRRRRREAAVLRALGTPARGLARARAIELTVLLGLGAAAGAITALIVVPLVVPALVSTAVPSALAAIPPVAGVDPLAAAVAALLLLAGCATAIAAAALPVLRRARRADPGRDLR